jgi:hypothetical protein
MHFVPFREVAEHESDVKQCTGLKVNLEHSIQEGAI